MATSKKYDYRVVKNRTKWKVEIIRRATANKTVVSKRKTGFDTEAQATEWAENELKMFLDHQAEKNKRHAKQRELRDEAEEMEAQRLQAAKEARA